MKAIIDRIEGELAVLEVGPHQVHWPADHLPPESGEGSILELRRAPEQGSLEEAKARLERLRSTGPHGDAIDL